MNPVRTYLLLLIVCVFGGNTQDPPGHLLPFGRHTVPHEVETRTNFPVPQEFFERYQLPGRPLVFKSILEEVPFPPYRLWNDDYLRKQFGDMDVEIEAGKKEIRDGNMHFKKMKDFLDMYKEQDVYMFQDVTEKSMLKDMYIPRSIQCGGNQNHIDTILMWFSSGGTKSVIHHDSQDNFNCLLDGTIDLILVDRKYKDLIEADGFQHSGGYSSIDVDSVDLYKYPKIQEVPTFKVNLKAGDCMFIPYKWYHQVNSFGSRNLAVNIWSAHISLFNDSDCDNVATGEQTVPFINYGYMKLFQPENIFMFDELLDFGNVSRTKFLEILTVPETDDKDKTAILEYVDENGDTHITWDELLQVDARDMVKRFGSSLKIGPTFYSELEEIGFRYGYDSETENDKTIPHDEF